MTYFHHKNRANDPNDFVVGDWDHDNTLECYMEHTEYDHFGIPHTEETYHFLTVDQVKALRDHLNKALEKMEANRA